MEDEDEDDSELFSSAFSNSVGLAAMVAANNVDVREESNSTINDQNQ